MAINIDFLANVGKFLKGTEDAEEALRDVGGSLDDLASTARRQGNAAGDSLHDGVQDGAGDAEKSVGRLADKLDELGGSDGGRKAGDDLRDGVEDGGRKAESSVDSLEARFSDLAAASSRQSSQVGDDLGKSVKKGTDAAEEGIEGVKESSASNLKEVAASFDGSFDSIAGGAQGLIAEIAEGFGPVGLIAGAVAAGGIGLIISGINGAQEKTEAYMGQVNELANTFIELGRTGGRNLEGISDQLKNMATAKPDEVILTLQDAYEKAGKAGADYQDIVLAIASASPREIGKARDALDEIGDSHRNNIKYAADYANDPNATLTPKIKAVSELDEALKLAGKQAKDAALAQELAAKAGLTDLALKKKAVDQVKTAYDDAAGGVDDYIDKESGVFDVKKYLKAMQEREDALIHYQETLQRSKLSPEAKNYIEGLGAEQAASLLAGYAKSSDKQKDKLNDIWSRAGKENADTYGDVLGSRLDGKTVKGPRVLRPDTDDYEKAVRDVQARAQQYLKDHPLQAGAVAYTGYGKPIF